MHNFRTG